MSVSWFLWHSMANFWNIQIHSCIARTFGIWKIVSDFLHESVQLIVLDSPIIQGLTTFQNKSKENSKEAMVMREGLYEEEATNFTLYIFGSIKVVCFVVCSIWPSCIINCHNNRSQWSLVESIVITDHSLRSNGPGNSPYCAHQPQMIKEGK